MDHKIEKQEYEALSKFRERIADLLPKFNDYQKHDIWLLRWLRARELNLGKAEEMIRNSLKFREEHKLDEILSWQAPDYIDQNFSCQAPGFDKEGCFVCTIPFGKWDIRKACSKGYKTEMLRFIGQLLENMMKYLEYRTTQDQYRYQFVTIMDYTDFSLSQIASKDTIDVITELLKIFEANYPETLKSAWVVNAPKYFEILFAIIKPILTARTISKIHIHGTSGWKEPLLKAIDADMLSSQFGGSINTVQNYKVRYGFDYEPKFETFPEDELKTQIVIAAGMKHSIENKISVGTTLSWNFRTDDYDLGYIVEFRKDSEEKPTILFSCDKVDSHLYVQKGHIVAEKTGTYTLILDNSNSRFRSKNVYFAVRVKSDV